jgi:hypothetical protein
MPLRALEDTSPQPAVLATRSGPPPEPEPVVRYGPDTPPTGLRKFDLGTIPASVTPPRTWRRAAWFAVGTAFLVVTALGFAAVTLVGAPRQNTTIDALPGQPSQQLLITDLPIDQLPTAGPPAPTSPAGPSPARTRTPPRPKDTGTQAHLGAGPGDAGPPPNPDSPTNPVRQTPANPPPTGTAPPRDTVDPAVVAITSAQALGDRTEQYYAQVLSDPAAAHGLTSGSLSAEGPEGIRARYADIKRIEVKQVTIEPGSACTRSVLVITRPDGGTVTVERELTFTTGADPRITSDSEPK